MSLIIHPCRPGNLNSPYLTLVVVDELGSDSLVTLGHHNVPDISPLALDLLKPPDLSSDPAIVDALGDTLDELALALNKPTLLEKVVLNLIKSNETGTALDGTEKPVRVLTLLKVKTPVLLGT